MGQQQSGPIKVYYDPKSYSCIRVLMYLKEAQLPHELVKVDLIKGEFHSPEFLKFNPRKQIPFLMQGDNIRIDESVGIIEYLGRIHPNESLFPTADHESCARNCKLIAQYHQRLDPKSILASIMWLHKSRAEIGEERIEALFKELDIWEDQLAQENDYLLGSDISTSDIVVFPVIACYFWLMGLSEKDYPFLAKWYHRMRERPSVKDLEFWSSYEPRDERKVLAVRHH